LQSTISYFRIDAAAARTKIEAAPPVDRAVSQLRAKAASMAAADRGPRKQQVSAKPARKAANGGGFAFAMDDSGNDRDADFQR